MTMELKHLNPQHVMDVTGKAIDEISRLRAENAELKAMLKESEDARYEAGADAADYYQENRRLKRALWLARAERALAERRRYCAMSAFEDIENDALRIKWCIIQRKCLAKSEEYK